VLPRAREVYRFDRRVRDETFEHLDDLQRTGRCTSYVRAALQHLMRLLSPPQEETELTAERIYWSVSTISIITLMIFGRRVS
jgi:hypothetical protein